MTSDIRTGVKTKEEYIEAATIDYVPSILALPKLKKYDLETDKITFKELSVENDSIVPSLLTAEMTEINAIKVSQKSHTFLSYGKGNTFRKDLRKNGSANIQTFHNQILRGYNIAFDQIALFGEGSNIGLLGGNSAGTNFYFPSSAEIPAVGSGDGFNRIQKAKEIAVAINNAINDKTAATDITVYFYGAALLSFLGWISPSQENDVRYHIKQAFEGKNVTFVDISALAATSALLSAASLVNGIVVVANNLVTLEHSGVPEIEDQGVNTEKKYYWSNYLLGSVQVRPEIDGAVIHQKITFAS
jgi:hypothetical protein